MKEGEAIDAAMVSVGKPPPTGTNSLAVSVAITSKPRDESELSVGSPVLLVAGARQIEPIGTIECERSSCRISVIFADTATLAFDAHDLATADLFPVKAGPTPSPGP